MTGSSVTISTIVDLVPDYGRSQTFGRFHRRVMNLVEETARYLDGDGRLESCKLEQNAQITYATESMRLTTRLMAVAGWVVAMRQGEGFERVDLERPYGRHQTKERLEQLPPKLVDLIEQSFQYLEEVQKLEARRLAKAA